MEREREREREMERERDGERESERARERESERDTERERSYQRAQTRIRASASLCVCAYEYFGRLHHFFSPLRAGLWCRFRCMFSTRAYSHRWPCLLLHCSLTAERRPLLGHSCRNANLSMMAAWVLVPGFSFTNTRGNVLSLVGLNTMGWRLAA